MEGGGGKFPRFERVPEINFHLAQAWNNHSYVAVSVWQNMSIFTLISVNLGSVSKHSLPRDSQTISSSFPHFTLSLSNFYTVFPNNL
jgi:hypothetical protein